MKILLVILFFVVSLISLFVGRDGVIDLNGIHGEFIFFNIRLPRLLLAFICGAGLSVAGWTFQILFRNPLATPYTLGVSSVAALAVAVSELLKQSGAISNSFLVFGMFYLPLMFLLLYGFVKRIDRNRLLLIGVCLGIFSSSAIVFIQSLLGNESVSRLVRWMMGSLDIVGLDNIYILAPIIFICLARLWFYRKKLTMISIGESFSFSRGIDVNLITFSALLTGNIMVAAIVWFCGPIGFVGLIIPHLVRTIYGGDFSKNFLVTLLSGATFLIVCDFISRVAMDTQSISIGAITACVGAPILMLKILRR